MLPEGATSFPGFVSPSDHPLHSVIQDWSKGRTVKPVLNGHFKIDKTNVLMENGSLMKVKSIAECSRWSILQYF